MVFESAMKFGKYPGNLRYPPPKATPPQEIAGLIFRDYENPLVSPNKAGYWGRLFLGGVALGSHGSPAPYTGRIIPGLGFSGYETMVIDVVP